MLTVEKLAKTYRARGRLSAPVQAVRDVNFTLACGESLAVVGESGSGKTTLGRMIARLLEPTSGQITFDGLDIGRIPKCDFTRAPQRRLIQHVFQDAGDSLTPHFTVFDAIADPLRRIGRTRADIAARVDEMIAAVSLPSDLAVRYPHQLSGGQRTRVGIARALAPQPSLLVLDEPTASLDVSVQAGILKLLARLRADFGLSYLLITHDIEVARLLSLNFMLMRDGEIVERGRTAEFLTNPRSDYGRRLLGARPRWPSELWSTGVREPPIA